MEELSTVAQRISAFVAYLGLSENVWRQGVGWSQGLLGKAVRENSSIGSDKLEAVLRKHPELSAEWLLTGKGAMLRAGVGQKSELAEPASPYSPASQGNIIVLDSRAAAGLARHYGQQEYLADRPRIQLHGDKYRGSDLLAIEIEGDSMMPTIRGGDWLVVRHLHHPREELRPGYVHVVVTRDGAVAKRVYPTPDGAVLVCKSDNHLYPPVKVGKADFLGLYLAVGLVRDDLSDQGSDLYNRLAILEADMASIKKLHP